MHKTWKRITALALTAALLLGAASCGKITQQPAVPADTAVAAPQKTYDTAPGTLRKAETVYANLDNTGAVQAVRVTDWLHTDKGEVAVADKSDLNGIADVKGSIVPVTDGDGLTWHMPTTDLYYKGTSDKKLPVEFTIGYKLDGKTMTPQEIAGQTGRVEICVQMKNVCEKDGVYLPVLAAGLMMLPEGVFSGVQIEHGLSIGDGAKEIIVGAGLPGMAESLHLKEDAKIGNISISDSFTITADVTDFELDNLYFIVVPLCSTDIGALIPGSDEEAAQFFRQVEKLLKAISKLNADELLSLVTSDRITEISDMLSKAMKTYNDNEPLLEVLSKYMTSENLESISALLTALQDPKTVEMLEKLDNPLMKNFLKGMPELLEAMQALMPMLTALQEDLQDPKVKAALDNMPQTLETLSEMKTALDENRDVLDLLGSLANDNMAEALQSFTESKDAQTLLTHLVDNADSLVPDLQKYVKFGQSYGLFTDAPDDAQISLLFVYMTPSLHAAAEAAPEPVQEALPWYKKIFSWI